MSRNLVAGFAVFTSLFAPALANQEQTMTLAHASANFRFELDLAYEDAAPLFGAKAESKWAPDWAPKFLYPEPDADIEGAVFRTDEGTKQARLWINTVFDLAGGHVQYVYVLQQEMVTRIDIRLTRTASNGTAVSVTYDRTALDQAANDTVIAASERDRANGPQWRDLIQCHAGSSANGTGEATKGDVDAPP